MTDLPSDIADFIDPPFVECPDCHRPAYGVIGISARAISRRCKNCMATARDEPLPSLGRKMTVFLDQSTISNIAKTLHPDLRGHAKTAAQPIWLRLYSALDVLVRAQLIVCPVFETHHDESMVSAMFAELKWLSDHLSGGVSFLRSRKILRLQLLEAARAHVAGTPARFDDLAESCIDGDLRAWLPKLHFVTIGRQTADVEALREARARGHAELEALHERWRDRPAPFAQRMAEESLGLIDAVQVELRRQQDRMEQLRANPASWTLNDMIASPLLVTLHAVSNIVARDASSPQEAIERLMGFLRSASAQTPYLRYTAAIYAVLAGQSARSRMPNQGTFNDVSALASLAPIADILIIDNGTDGLIKQMRPEFRPPYANKIYCTRTLPDLAERLESMIAAVTPEHAATLTMLYGDWRRPQLSLFSQLPPAAGDREDAP